MGLQSNCLEKVKEGRLDAVRKRMGPFNNKQKQEHKKICNIVLNPLQKFHNYRMKLGVWLSHYAQNEPTRLEKRPLEP